MVQAIEDTNSSATPPGATSIEPWQEKADAKKYAEEMRAEVEGLLTDALEHSAKRLPRLAENMAFFRGFQHSQPTQEGLVGTYDERQEFETLNVVQAIVRQSVARRLQAFPLSPDVVPSHDGVLARARADASARLIRSLPRNGILPFEEVLDAVYASEIHGAAWLKVFWDPSRGKATGEGFEGDVGVQFVSVLEAVVDSKACRARDVRHVFHRKVMPLSTAEDLFPVDTFGDSTQGRFLAYGSRPSEGFVQLDEFHDWSNYAASRANESVEVIEYWEKPTFKYPNGRLVVFSGVTILAFGELPYRWPWVFVAGPNRAPGMLYPDGQVHNLKSPQRSLNHAASKVREHLSLVANPAILASTVSGVQADSFEDIAGAVIRHEPGQRPEWMQPPAVSGGLFEQIQSMRDRLSDISVQSDVAQGQPITNLSGRAISFLQELNSRAHQTDDVMLQEAIVEIYRLCLHLIRTRYADGRMMRIFGPNNVWQSRAFSADDYDFECEIVVDPFAQRPNSRATRLAEALEIMQYGGYAATPEAAAFRRHIDVDTDDKREIDLEYAHQRRALGEEIGFLLQGQMPVCLPQDDDQIHLMTHETFVISDEFLGLPPEVQDAFLQHIAQHELQDAQKMGAMGAQQVMMDGGQGTSGPAAQGAATADEAAEPGIESPQDGGHAAEMDQLALAPSVDQG